MIWKILLVLLCLFILALPNRYHLKELYDWAVEKYENYKRNKKDM